MYDYDDSEVPASCSYGPDDIPSVMVTRSDKSLTDEEIALIAITLHELTSDSLETPPDSEASAWRMSAVLSSLRGHR